MIGPFEHGHWTAKSCESEFQSLIAGRRYAVRSDFVDFDGDTHRSGETWKFLGANFLPFDDGQSLFVSLDGMREWHIRLQWRAEQQAHVLDNLDYFIQPDEIG